jgi:hypothetical protein
VNAVASVFDVDNELDENVLAANEAAALLTEHQQAVAVDIEADIVDELQGASDLVVTRHLFHMFPKFAAEDVCNRMGVHIKPLCKLAHVSASAAFYG